METNLFNRVHLATTEPFNIYRHGKTNQSSPNIEHYSFVDEIIEPNEFIGGLYDNISTLELIKIIELPGQEQVAIFKTIWLRILQRKWKQQHNDINP